MKKTIISAAAVLLIMMSSCKTNNPLLEKWDTPFQIPPFEKIEAEHFMPAFKEAMKQHNAEIKEIVTNSEEANFQNTILAYDQSGKLLSSVAAVFESVSNMDSNDEVMAIAQEVSPLLTAHSSEISLNEDLFSRIKTVYEKRATLGLKADELRLIEVIYTNFERSGINLPKEKKEKLKEVNNKISELQLVFEQNLLKETASYKLVVNDKNKLTGLSEAQLSEAASRAAADSLPLGNYVFGLDNPSVMPFLGSADNRELRNEILTAFLNRCNNNNANDNKKVVYDLVKYRLEKAKLLGYEDYASYVLEDRMAATPEAVYELLMNVWKPAVKVAKKELKDIEKVARKEGMTQEIKTYDWRYYTGKAKANKFNLSSDELKPYFMIDNVREGMFYMAKRLYGITFTQLNDVPVPHKEASAWECKEADGTHLGILFLDMFARPGEKRGGAWCTSYREQTYNGTEKICPILTIVGNFARPAVGEPALLTADETETMFHEFGHALQGLLQNVRFLALTPITRDFVELPSQIAEHWAFEPEVLAVYAKHYKTGEVIPFELVNKLVESGKYGQGFATVENIAASLLDMDYHSLVNLPKDMDVIAFEERVLADRGLNTSVIAPRYRSTYFAHTMGGGYTAGYYSYLWAAVLDNDAYQAFKETGDIFNQEVAQKFRKEILEHSNEAPAMDLYVNFRGHKPSTDALLKARGLN